MVTLRRGEMECGLRSGFFNSDLGKFTKKSTSLRYSFFVPECYKTRIVYSHSRNNTEYENDKVTVFIGKPKKTAPLGSRRNNAAGRSELKTSDLPRFLQISIAMPLTNGNKDLPSDFVSCW